MFCAAGAPCPCPVPPRSLWKRAEPGCVPGRQGRAGPSRAHTTFRAVVWIGYGSVGADPWGAGLALEPRAGTAMVAPGPGPRGTTTTQSQRHHVQTTEFQTKKKEKTTQKAFCQCSPWPLPGDLVEVADWHHGVGQDSRGSGRSWHGPAAPEAAPGPFSASRVAVAVSLPSLPPLPRAGHSLITSVFYL